MNRLSLLRIGSLAILIILLLGLIGPIVAVAQSTPEADATPLVDEDGNPITANGKRIYSISPLVTTGPDEVTPAEQALAEKFRPILNMTAQRKACDKSGDVYFPTTVDFVFDNPDIKMQSAVDGTILAQPITPQDLAITGDTTYINFPGNPRAPGCTFEKYFLKMKAQYDLKPTTYAHIYYDAVNHRLWLEYWFYYSFNHWNDTHESDWEMLLMSFNTTSAEEAITMVPSLVGYAQHGGGETATWKDRKLSKQGDRVIAYSSAGSHATYFTDSTYIGWGENGTAFGCDKTLGPYNQYDLDVVVVPSVIDPEGPFAWALYTGRWGEKQASVFNGPYGPNPGKKWNDPAAAVENWRGTSLMVPGSKALGPSSTDLFCTLSEQSSRAGIFLGAHLWITLGIVLAVLALFGLLLARIWVSFVEAIDIYGLYLRTFLGIGLLCIPIGLGFNILLHLLMNQPPLDWINKWFAGSGGQAAGAFILGGVQQLTMVMIVSPIVIYTMRRIRDRQEISIRQCVYGGLSNIPHLAATLLLIVIILLALSTSIFLLPVVVYLAVRWQFFAQAVVLDEKRGIIDALQRSAHVVQGKWWRAAGLSVGFQIVGLMPGPLIGTLILIIGGSKVEFANFVSSFLYAIFVPISVIGLTMAYHRLKGNDIVEGMYGEARRRDFQGIAPAPTPPPSPAGD
ncbi:MAG TPA: hypothetical protein PK819_07250 [Thermomicrobiales bacterium]|nr:hypothetical protein [Thermomicrobiales bacterium]